MIPFIQQVGWLVGWLNILGLLQMFLVITLLDLTRSNSGQIAGIASTEFGLASMILAGVNIGMVSLRMEWNVAVYLTRTRIMNIRFPAYAFFAFSSEIFI